MRKKLITAVIALTLVLTSLVGVTVAWLSVNTDPVTNTFSPSNIGLTLTETERTYKMVPGTEIAKDPKVTVTNDIDCYVFVKVAKTTNFDTYMTYRIAGGWSEVTSAADGDYKVYYREVKADDNNKTFSVLDGDKVVVPNTVTKTDMDKLYDTNGAVVTANQPKMTFTAYAIQKTGFATAAEAWAEAQKLG